MQNKREPIYKNTHVNPAMVAKLQPLFESSFADALSGFDGKRANYKEERLKFAATQYANRMRIAENMGVTALNEDAQIFGQTLGDGIKKLFESASMPSNIIGMGNITSPGNPTTTPGGIWGSTYQVGSGDIPSYVFGLQSQIALHCQGFDLLPTISVDTPKIMLNFVDTVYGGGELDGEDDYPSILEFASKLFTYAKLKDLKFKRAATKVVLWDGNAGGAAPAVAGKAVEVLFYNSSLEKPAINAEILNFGESNDGITITKADGVSLVSVVEAFNASLATANKAKIVVDGTVLTAAQAPTTTGDEISLNYVSATRTNIAEAATNDNSWGGMSRKQHRKGPKHKLNIISMDKEVHIGGIEIDADTDNIQIKDMAAQGISVIARLYAGVQNQLIQTIDEYITTHLYRLGVQHAVSAYEAQGINHSLFIANPGTPSLNPTTLNITFEDVEGNDKLGAIGVIKNSIQSSGYENQTTHADRLYARLLKTAEYVAQQNRSQGPDYILVGGELAATLKKNSTYTISPSLNTLTQRPELHYTGTIFQDMALYKNPRIHFNDPRILLGRRGDDTDSGAKFLAYDLAASRQTLAEGTMAEKIRAWSRFEIADVGFYPELNYYTMIAINEYDWS